MDTITESGKFGATLDSLSLIRKFLGDAARVAGLEKSLTYKLSLAVDEIVSNIVNYGYPRSGINEGYILVTVSTTQHKMTVMLEDAAVPFNPLTYGVPGEEDLAKPMEDRPIGGLGIMLARENVDEFNYRYENGKNINIFCINQ
jgi:serine/threonine-protein kinase RsbW